MSDSRMYMAAMQGDRRQVEEFVRQGGLDADQLGTMLNVALSGEADVEVIRMLLDAGADPNIAVHGETPLMAAARRDRGVAVMQALIDGGADLHALNGSGYSALCSAVMATDPNDGADRVEYVRLLLECGADPDACGGTAASPLVLACTWGRLRSCEALLEAGARIDEHLLADDEFWKSRKPQLRRLLEAHKMSRGLAAAMQEDGAPAVRTTSVEGPSL